MSLVTVLASIIGALLTGSGGAAVVNAFARRRPVRVEAADRLSDSTLKWVEQFQEEASAARREAADMRREAADARREASEVRVELRAVRHEAQELADQLLRVRTALSSPTTTLDHLRMLVGVGLGSETNGGAR